MVFVFKLGCKEENANVGKVLKLVLSNVRQDLREGCQLQACSQVPPSPPLPQSSKHRRAHTHARGAGLREHSAGKRLSPSFPTDSNLPPYFSDPHFLGLHPQAAFFAARNRAATPELRLARPDLVAEERLRPHTRRFRRRQGPNPQTEGRSMGQVQGLRGGGARGGGGGGGGGPAGGSETPQRLAAAGRVTLRKWVYPAGPGAGSRGGAEL